MFERGLYDSGAYELHGKGRPTVADQVQRVFVVPGVEINMNILRGDSCSSVEAEPIREEDFERSCGMRKRIELDMEGSDREEVLGEAHLHATKTSGGLETLYARYEYHITPPPLPREPTPAPSSIPISSSFGSAYTSTQYPRRANSRET